MLVLKSWKTFSVSLTDSCINHDEFLSVDNVIREYNEIKEEIKNPENAIYTIKNNVKLLYQLYKNTANKNSSVRRIRQNRLMLSSNCVICGKKKSRSIKNQKARGLLSTLGIRTPSSNIPLIVYNLF